MFRINCLREDAEERGRGLITNTVPALASGTEECQETLQLGQRVTGRVLHASPPLNAARLLPTHREVL